MGHYTGGLSPGDDSHSVMCEAVSSCRALRNKSSRSLPCGRDLICSLTRSASCAKHCSNGALGWFGWMRGILLFCIQAGALPFSQSPIKAEGHAVMGASRYPFMSGSRLNSKGSTSLFQRTIHLVRGWKGPAPNAKVPAEIGHCHFQNGPLSRRS
jgi:hypothetical protein